MIKTTPIVTSIGFALATLFSNNLYANNDLSQAEAETIVKEDLASVQVMAESCPALIGQNTKFDQNIQKLIQEHLSEFSDTSISYDKIQNDQEYKTLLNEAREGATQISKSEQQQACNEVVSY